MNKYRALIIVGFLTFSIMGCGIKTIGSENPLITESGRIGRELDNRNLYMPTGKEIPYCSIIDKYIEAINNHIDVYTAGEKELFSGVQYDWISTDNVAYSLIDLNDDGIRELIFLPVSGTGMPYGYNDNYLYAIYTIKDDKVLTISTTSFGPRDDGYYLYDGSIIKLKLGGTGIVKNIYFNVNSVGELEYIEEIDEVALPSGDTPENEWYKCSDKSIDLGHWPSDDNLNGTHYFEKISKGEAKAIQHSYEKQIQIDRNKLADYELYVLSNE